MLSLNRICIYIIMLGITFVVPSIRYITFLDEICSYALLLIALTDCITNGSWRKYTLLWIIMGLMTFYAWYSITQLDYNITSMILKDWIIELKPYIPFCVLFAIGPQFSEDDKRYIRIVCLINASLMLIAFIGGINLIKLLVFHPAYAGHITFTSGLFYYYCSRDRATGIVSRRNTIISILILSVGILSFKAKYYGMIIPAVYLLTIYRPGTFRKFSFKHAIISVVLIAGIIVASWSKIQYYFISGDGGGTFDPTAVQSFARPVLYMTGTQILVDHFPLGTGLASFASATSAMNYSNVYFEYGIHNVHGISMRSEVSFICDSFYPSLAQFGVLGMILFICFWFYIYRYLRVIIRENDKLYRSQFVTGSIIIIFILVESIAATTFTQTAGMTSMSLLGMSCAFGRRVLAQQKSEVVTTSLSTRKI